MRSCVCCLKVKNLSDFGSTKAFKSGLDSSCRDCRLEKVRSYRATPNGRAKSRGTVERYHKSPKGRAAKRRYEETENGREKRREHASVHREKHPVKIRARLIAHYAEKCGKIERKPCGVCSDAKTEAHHIDYSRPLDVVWLCKTHHDVAHDRVSAVRYPL